MYLSLLTLSASSTSQIFTPVAGLKVGNVLPLQDLCHSLLIKICWEPTRVVNFGVGVTADTCESFILGMNSYNQHKQLSDSLIGSPHLQQPYLGVPDLLDFDRLGKRHSWDLFDHAVLCCSVLCHFKSAAQSTTSLPALSTKHCEAIHWLFIRMWSSSLLTQQQRRRAQLRPYKNIMGPYLRRILFLQYLGNILQHVFIHIKKNSVSVQ